MVLSVDLKKYYDRVNWSLMCLMLLQIGLSLHLTTWMMSCIETINYFVLINKDASNFFKEARGLRKGFPLSPLLFFIGEEILKFTNPSGGGQRKSQRPQNY